MKNNKKNIKQIIMRPRLNNKYIKQGDKPINGSGLVFSKEMCELTINQV